MRCRYICLLTHSLAFFISGELCLNRDKHVQVTVEKLQMHGAIVVRSYMEALGLMAAHKSGVNPACLTSNIHSIRDFRV